MIYSSIAVGIYKRLSLSYVDRRTEVFCLVNRLSEIVCVLLLRVLILLQMKHDVIVTTLYQHSVNAD